MSKLIDTHTHVNFQAFKDDADEVIKRALDSGVWLINAGSQFETSRRAVELANDYPEGVYAVVGLHPIHLFSHYVDEEEIAFESREEEFDYEKYKALAVSPKVVGIGEGGLEYYDAPAVDKEQMKAKQRAVFLEQIQLARELDKALVVHSRDTYADIYEVLVSLEQRPARILIHSFIGNWQEAEKLWSLDCYFSLNGIITYKPSKEKKPGRSDPGLLEAVKNLPLERIVLETDAPYLAPEPVRGRRNEPSYVKYVAQKLAEIKKIDLDEVATATTENARKLFKI
jgi:TatD DNase family protein